MQIAKCNTYHARTDKSSVLRMPDGRSVFKIYFVSIVGRDRHDLYEWRSGRRSFTDFEEVFLSGGYEGIGFAVSFPHVTKIYRFSPDMETIMDVREFETNGMAPRNCSRRDGFHEFACYAEAVIAADEYRAWAEATTVNEYLAFLSSAADFPLLSNEKLSTYWEITSS